MVQVKCWSVGLKWSFCFSGLKPNLSLAFLTSVFHVIPSCLCWHSFFSPSLLLAWEKGSRTRIWRNEYVGVLVLVLVCRGWWCISCDITWLSLSLQQSCFSVIGYTLGEWNNGDLYSPLGGSNTISKRGQCEFCRYENAPCLFSLHCSVVFSLGYRNCQNTLHRHLK